MLKMKNKGENKITVTEIQRFCMHDGPGVRTVVFLKGCPLRCAWCHNPETQSRGAELQFFKSKCINCKLCLSVCPSSSHNFDTHHTVDRGKCLACGACAEVCPTRAVSLCGRAMSVNEIVREIEKDLAFYGSVGGVTISGGEPFAQGAGTIALLRECSERGINTVVETSGFAEGELIGEAAPFVNLFLWDIKDTDSLRHKEYTGVANEKIIDNLFLADKLGAKTRLRCILVSGVNTVAAHYEGIAKIYKSLANCQGVELLPYHAYGGSKAEFIGLSDNGNPAWIPTEEQIREAEYVLKSLGVKII